jgi:hypothetical protein
MYMKMEINKDMDTEKDSEMDMNFLETGESCEITEVKF